MSGMGYRSLRLLYGKMQQTPFVAISLSLITGILLARYIPFNPIHIFIILFILLAIAGIQLLISTKSIHKNHHHNILTLVIFLSGICIGALRYHLVYYHYPTTHIVNYCQETPRLATIRGVIQSSPEIKISSGTFAKFDFMHEPNTRFILKITKIKKENQWQDSQGMIKVFLKRPGSFLTSGQTIEFDCWISKYKGPSNPGQFDPTDLNRSQRLLVNAFVDYPEAITILNQNYKLFNFYKIHNTIKNYAQKIIITDAIRKNKNIEAFISALLLGKREGLQENLNDIFIQSGCLHFLSISGLHVGILASFIWWITWLFHAPRWLRGMITIAFIILFICIVPVRAPILRSGIVAIVFSLAFMSRHPSHPINLLSFAAIIILLLNPIELFNAGFQLSFLVVIGLIYFTAPIQKFLLREPKTSLDRVRLHYASKRRPFALKVILKLYKYIIILLTISFIAWCTGFPLSAFHFNRVALWGIFASTLLYIPIAILLLLGCLKIFLSFLLPSLVYILDECIIVTSQFAIETATWFSILPYKQWIISDHHIVFPISFYAILLYIVLRYKQHKKTRASILLSIWLSLFIWIHAIHPKTNYPSLHTLDVGHGLCLIYQTSDGKTLCYDAGSINNFHVGQTTILPFLRAKGIGTIDAMFISHANIDHYVGIIDLCKNLNINSLYCSEKLLSNYSNKPHTATGSFISQIISLEQSIIPLNMSSYSFDNLELTRTSIKILWPPNIKLPLDISSNDHSLVLKISDQYGSILLTGDIGEIPQKWLIENRVNDLRSDIMLLPHHGSITRNLKEFTDCVNPKYIINSSRTIQPERLKKLTALLSSYTILHTFQKGAISIELHPENFKINYFNK